MTYPIFVGQGPADERLVKASAPTSARRVVTPLGGRRLWLTGYAFAVAKAGDLFQRARVRRWIEGVTGAVLVALGVRLATQRWGLRFDLR